MFIKQRKAKPSSRGIYIQDKELMQTRFQPGQSFTYAVDPVNRKVIILPSKDKSSHTVSKRKLDDQVKPVIDIRSREALSLMADSDYLTVTIHEDQVVVESFQTVATAHVNKAVTGKIVRLEQFMPVRKVSSFRCSRDQFRKVVGGPEYAEQIEFSFGESFGSVISDSYVRQAVDLSYVPMQIASLFSGAGMLDYGFLQAGFDIVFANDLNADACQTYRANIGNHIFHGDINDAIRMMPQVPVVIGGSPCQGFSNNNRVSNFLDNPNNLMVRKYIEAVKKSGCMVFVLENVPQLLTAGGGRFKDEIKAELSEFEITERVLTATDYGSAQGRDRAIMIGSKIGRIDLPAPTYRPEEYRTVRMAFEGIHDGLPNQADVSASKPENIEKMKHIPPGGNVFNIPEEIRPKSQHSNMYKRLEWDKPSITIANARKAMILHPEENRILSVRECARIQGLPDSFIFKGSLGGRQQQVANGVPFEMAHAIGRQIKKAIMKFNSLFKTPAFA